MAAVSNLILEIDGASNEVSSGFWLSANREFDAAGNTSVRLALISEWNGERVESQPLSMNSYQESSLTFEIVQQGCLFLYCDGGVLSLDLESLRLRSFVEFDGYDKNLEVVSLGRAGAIIHSWRRVWRYSANGELIWQWSTPDSRFLFADKFAIDQASGLVSISYAHPTNYELAVVRTISVETGLGAAASILRVGGKQRPLAACVPLDGGKVDIGHGFAVSIESAVDRRETICFSLTTAVGPVQSRYYSVCPYVSNEFFACAPMVDGASHGFLCVFCDEGVVALDLATLEFRSFVAFEEEDRLDQKCAELIVVPEGVIVVTGQRIWRYRANGSLSWQRAVGGVDAQPRIAPSGSAYSSDKVCIEISYSSGQRKIQELMDLATGRTLQKRRW